MGTVIFLPAVLAGAIVVISVHLARRERARGSHCEDAGLLVELERTRQAAQLRTTYSSRAVHHATGMACDDLHKYYS
ncbi:hypothetical protein [Streptomyces sp. CBMA123]|uniref:hypothetical protein n=1 Tax=Streptomyces sp. CBMA123 TaxID=1896313 RepID=UPI001661A14F|nr:hypothetical protein [Streptomyces sp. CBMA123]MBD0693671.1 hypothetical protein [Streptomyces sp. CBMA123]